MSRRPLNRETFIALRATRAATRLASAILVERVTGLAVRHCAHCGRAIAVATDTAHPAGDVGGPVVCRFCIQAEQITAVLMQQLPEPPLDLCLGQNESWVRAGKVKPFEPDPRPTLRGWLRGKFRQRSEPKADP